MAQTADQTRARAEALRLFYPHLITPAPKCARCRDYARTRDTATGPLRGTVVTDMQLLMKRLPPTELRVGDHVLAADSVLCRTGTGRPRDGAVRV
ncbi:hypothetical protein ACQKM2_40640 [Streptomyces sp. NPDC004126]|uniref:hypothetical protein n=1 Tax=Streptomyces sp. NPDC004126 TaxID=3390695 RepID=UPI003CFC1EA7